jgi:hypothetical protein
MNEALAGCGLASTVYPCTHLEERVPVDIREYVLDGEVGKDRVAEHLMTDSVSKTGNG